MRSYTPRIYVSYDEEEGTYYIGQAKNIERRPMNGREKIAEFPASAEEYARHIQETEMIQFCEASGLPLGNKQQRKWPFVGYEITG